MRIGAARYRSDTRRTWSRRDAAVAAPLMQQLTESAVAQFSELSNMHSRLNKISRTHGNRMGNIGSHKGSRNQTRFLFDLALHVAATESDRRRGSFRYDRRNAAGGLRLCEIGFNVGHSAAAFLYGVRAVNMAVALYLIFDLGTEPGSAAGLDVLRATFRTTTFEFVSGNSIVTVPNYTATHTGLHCDLVHIDGNHAGSFPRLDWMHVQPLARPDSRRRSFVVFDDCGCQRQVQWCAAPTRLFYSLVTSGNISFYGARSFWDRGSCAGWVTTGVAD